MHRLLSIVLLCIWALAGVEAVAQAGHFGPAMPTDGWRTPAQGPFVGGCCAPGSFRVPGPFRDGVVRRRFAGRFFPGTTFVSEPASVVVPGEPQVIVVREERAAPMVQAAPAPLPQPKMIDVPGSASVTAETQPQGRALVIFRDGRQLEMSRYTLTGAYLYDSSKPLETTRIPLHDLDLVATAQANAARGIAFPIPAERNEVIVRF